MLTLQKTNAVNLIKESRKRCTEVFPRATKRVFVPATIKKRKPTDVTKQPIKRAVNEKKPRVNPMGIQMLSKPIYDQIFKNLPVTSLDEKVIQSCKATFEKFNIKTETDFIEDVDFVIPALEGSNLEEHFWKISSDQSEPYRKLIEKILLRIPSKPKTWVFRVGWTRYSPDREPEQIEAPAEDVLIFDVEVCMSAGKTPTLATAVSDKAWYGWVSPALIEGSSKPITNHFYADTSLIPFGTTPRVVVGHNVSFDRSKIKEQYRIENTKTRFLDTMSLHVCVSGITSYQRAVLKSKNDKTDDHEPWKSYGSLNSLSDVHNLYCGSPIEKEARNIFFDGSLSEIKSDFLNLMDYCANDVMATYRVLKSLFPLFSERFPHPATLAGMLELSTAYLPVNSNWERYIEESDQTFEDLEIESRLLLAKRADLACQLLHEDRFKKDIWMWDLDWDVKNIKLKKSIKKNKNNDKQIVTGIVGEESNCLFTNLLEVPIDETNLIQKFVYLDESKLYLSAVRTLLPGYPNWYRKLCTKPDSEPNWIPGPHLITTSMQVTPKLLNLTWEGYPLHYIREHGWGLLVPFDDDYSIARKLPLPELIAKCPVLTKKSNEANTKEINISKDLERDLSRKEYYSRLKKDKSDGLYKGTGVWCNTIIEDCCYFYKLPHKDGSSFHVGNPLAKDFLTKFSENVLAGDTESAEKVLEIARKMSYWRNNRDRILNQMVVWNSEKSGAIIPQVVVSGTLTRRAVEPTWMTASNAHPERIGSELRAMVQAPKGYCIIGADVDSQELWIASVIGDSMYKMQGATPLGWMTLSGDKSSGTDMHSVTAKAVGISRDHAKVINYARIYGAGQNFAERLIKQFNPSMSESEARIKANKMFSLTKGKLIYELNEEYFDDLPNQMYSKWQAMELSKAHGKKIKEMFSTSRWVGGTESAMFNSLEKIAGTPEPITPFLNSRLSRALEPSSTFEDRFLPTRINWVVQSGAVDFLHLMLVCMRWLMGDRARFCLSFHDEIRYLVPEKHKYKAALAMHVTNLMTRAFCAMKLGLHDLPQSVAFFSSVEIDTVLRKDSKQDCRTPSNPHGLERGYGIPNGESLNVYEAIEKARGNNKNWYK